MEVQAIISNALKEEYELDNIKLAKIAGFNDKELEMIKMFWEPAFNKSWIYLSSEIIHEYFGYKKSDSSIKDFNRKMKETYKENIDYKEVNKNHEIVEYYKSWNQDRNPGLKTRDGALRKYYIITGETFKKMCMRANTVKGDETCDYYIKIESLCNIMSKYLIEKLRLDQQKQLQEKEQLLLESKEAFEQQTKALELSESKNLKLKQKIQNDKVYKLEGWVYLATNEQYALQNHFRFGKTTNLKVRISGYKTGRTKEDLLYFVFTYKSEDIGTLETIIRNMLKDYRDDPKIDMYTLHWSSISKYVKYICDVFHGSIIPFTNDFIISNIDINDIPISPEKLDIPEIEDKDKEIIDYKCINLEEYNIEDMDNEEDENNEKRDNEVVNEEAQTKEDEQNDNEIEPEEESEKTIKTITNEVVNRTVETIETTKTTTTQRLFKCKPCGEYKSYKFFGENAQRNKRHKRCIECRNKKNVSLQIHESELIIYKCLGCLEEKNIDEFKIEEERNDRCNQCIINNIPKKKIKSIFYTYCIHGKHKCLPEQLYIRQDDKISSICLQCMKSRFDSLITPLKNKLKKTPRNYKSKLLQIINKHLNKLTLHDIFGKPEIKDLDKYRRCSGNHIHEIDRWQLIDEFAICINGRGTQCRTNNCKKCRQC